MVNNFYFKNIERTENLNRYFDDIKHFKVMTAEEELNYIVRAQMGDEDSRNKLIEANQRYIFSYAKKYSNAHNVLDLVSIAVEGFSEAISNFDITKGNRLCTYGNYWMAQTIKKYLVSEHLMVKKPNYSKTHSKITKIKNKFFLENGRYPQVEEVKTQLEELYKIKIKNYGDLVDVNVNSINQAYDGDDMFFEDTPEFNQATASVNNYEKEIETEYNKALTNKMLATLNEKERTILVKIFGIGCDAMEMENVAEEMGMSKERIRQIRNEALSKLNNRFSSPKKRVI